METVFYIAGAVAVASTILMLTRVHAVHALLYLILSLLSVAIVFYTLGAPFVAALEVIIYAGAIMVLFVFVVMMLNIGPRAVEQERRLLAPGTWLGPSLLALVLVLEVGYILSGAGPPGLTRGDIRGAVDPKQVGIVLFGPYLIAVELASMLLMAGLVGAYHLGARMEEGEERRRSAYDSGRSRVAAGGDLVRVGADRDPGAP